MGEAGRRRVEAEFSWEAVGARLEKLLAEAAR
jgi:glycosyltransferase involved in cell wall biosynthesis